MGFCFIDRATAWPKRLLMGRLNTTIPMIDRIPIWLVAHTYCWAHDRPLFSIAPSIRILSVLIVAEHWNVDWRFQAHDCSHPSDLMSFFVQTNPMHRHICSSRSNSSIKQRWSKTVETDTSSVDQFELQLKLKSLRTCFTTQLHVL